MSPNSIAMGISKKQADIVQVVSRSVELKRAGNVYVGLCPFHLEDSPSFTVYPETQSWYCFGCKRSGGLSDFGGGSMSVPIRMPKPVCPARLFNRDIVDYWHRMLKSRRDYFRGRGFPDSMIDEESWGFSVEHDAYSIPVWSGVPGQSDAVSVKLRARAIDAKTRYFGVEGFNNPTVYNRHVLANKPNEVLIVFGELDAKSVEVMGSNAVSPTAGSSGFREEWVSLFSGIENVLVVPDNTAQEVGHAAKVASYFGSRGKVWRLPDDAKDFNEYLLKHGNLDLFRENNRCVADQLTARWADRWVPSFT